MFSEAFHWYASIFLWMLFTGIGLPPVPEEAGILYAAGLTALNPEVRWWLAWPAASLGIIAADLVLYGIGRLWGQRLLEHRWVGMILAPERRRRLEDRFHTHGMKFLIMARLLPPLRTGIFLIAGTIRYSPVRFLIADLFYGVIGVGLLFFGGTGLLTLIHQAGNWLLVVFVFLGIALAIAYFYRYLRLLELKATEKALATVDSVVGLEKTTPTSPETSSTRTRR